MPRPTDIERTPMARAIRRFRVSLGDTQREFAARTGLAVPTIGRYETNAQPSKDVLARFADIARSEKLALFTEIFDGQVEPDSVDFEAQEVAGAVHLLRSALIDLRQKKSAYRKARLLLSIHLLPPSEYANAE